MARTELGLQQQLADRAGKMAAAEQLSRTIDITSVNNSTKYTILLALGQGLDEAPVCDPPHVRDTGVTVCGTNVGPQTRQVGTIQAGINVRSTRVKWSCRWRHIATGREGDLTAQDLVCQPGYYWPHPAFGISDPKQATEASEVVAPEFWMMLAPVSEKQ